MTALFIDIIVIFALFILLYIGFQAGIVRSFFAALAGFCGIVFAEHYPYQVGINYYLIFCCAALITFLVGLFIVRILKFICLSLFDKIAGSVLCLFIWFVVSANFIIPALDQTAEKMDKITERVSDVSATVFPIFDKYVPEFAIDKKLKNSDKYILFKK